ncbi:MAG TPA: CARDB domain-containing protein, partial [bacterium]|nr:CARDB domain-containing protein [bacterium]
YRLAGLNEGLYRIRFDQVNAGYLARWYNDRSDQAAADSIPVTPPDETPGIDAVLRYPRVTAEVAAGNGTVFPASQDIFYGQPAAVTAVAADGFSYQKYTLDGTDHTPGDSTLEINQVMADSHVTVTFIPVADLRVKRAEAPAEIWTGSAFDLTWELENRGLADIGAVWTDYIYLSSDDQVGNDTPLVGFNYNAGLNAGASVTRIQTITIPRNLLKSEGSVYLLVVTDFHNNVYEGQSFEAAENNNRRFTAQPVQVRVSPMPDLEVSMVNPPSSSFSGQNATFSFTIKNTGNGPTDAALWYDAAYLSLDTQFQPNIDTLLNNPRNGSYLAPEDTYTTSFEARLPNGLEGSYYLLVAADAYNWVGESLEDNNLNYQAFPITLTTPPNLKVISVTAPPVAASGQPVEVSWQVKNDGNGPINSSWWSDQVFLSEDTSLDTGDHYLGNFYKSGSLASKESYEASLTVTLPAGVSGPRYFLVWTDRNNYIYEHASEDDNVGATDQPSNITLVAPDLEVLEVAAPGSATASRNLTVRFTVVNNGTAATSNNSWTDAVYLSEDTGLDTGDLCLGEKTHFYALTESDTYLAELTVTLPDAISGTRYLLVWTDNRRQVVELDDLNNVWASGPVNVLSRPADLVISNVTAPAASDSGRAVTVAWKVTNSGTGDTVASNWADRVYLSRDTQLDTALDIQLGSYVHEGRLDIGETYQRSEPVELPIALDGDYYLFVLADASGSVYEGSSEANNRSEPLPIRVTRVIPDLQALLLNAPAEARSGDAIALDWTVRNNGNGRTDADLWRDAIYLSADASLDTEIDTRLGLVHHTGRIDPGASYNGSGTVSLPPDVSGTCYLFLFANSDAAVTEIDRGNNGRRAEAATIITLTPAPDLAVTAVSPPASILSGQPFTLNWTVANQDASIDTSLSWIDSAWLSRDQVLDNTDLYLGSFSRNALGLAGGTSYTGELRATVPMGLTGPYYIFVRTDISNRVYERGRKANNLGYNTPAVQVDLPAPADFQPLAEMTFPDTGIAGQTVNIGYRVQNQGVNAFQGSWTDALYLSSDDQWSSDDLLLGRISKNTNLAPGQEYAGALNTVLPGVVPGYYHVIASTDIYNNVLESEEANNRTASAGRIYVDAELLELDRPDTGILGYGQSVYYRLNVPVAGETMLLSFDSVSESNPNELYLSFGRMPNRGSFDFAYDRPFSPDQEVVVPLTRDGDYYVLAYNSGGWQNARYTILARLIPFSLRAVDPAEAGNAGPSTLKISGARFTRDTAFRLIDPAGAPLDPTRTLVKDSTIAYATFDLTGRNIGRYRLLALKAGETAEFDSGLVVNPGLGPNLQAEINGPSPIRPSRDYIFYVDYANTGDGDAAAPILLVESTTNTAFGFNINELVGGQVLQILGSGSADLGGIIRPGEGFGFPMYFRSPDTIQPVEFRVWIITVDDTRPIDWGLVEQLIRPAGIPEAEWQLVWSRIKDRIGTTWGDYVRAMGEMANLLSGRGEDASDVRLLFAELFNQVSGYPTSRLSGRVINGETGQLMAGATVVARLELTDQAQPDTYISHLAATNAAGEFLFTNLPVGTYGFHVENYRVDPAASDTMIAVGYDTDALGLVLYAYPIPADTLSPPAPDDDQEARLTLGSDGTPHLVWRRGKALWHAYRDGSGWTGAPLVDAATGDTLTGYETRLTAAANLFEGTPRTPGLFLTWRRGEGNQAELAYATGRPRAGGGFEWSAQATVTADSILDQHPALVVTNDGRVLLVFLKSDAAVSDTATRVRDDADLYFERINLDPAGLSWPALVRVPLGTAADGPGTVYVPLADAQTFSFAMGIQKETADPLPSIIPIIGGKRCKFWVDGQVTGGATCKAIAAGQLQGEVQLFERVTGALAASVSAEWGSNCDQKAYVFNKASINLTAQATGEIPAFYYMVPGDGWFVDKLFELEAGATVTGSISGSAGWEAANFPGLPNTGEVAVSVGLGPYGKAKALDGTLEGTLKGVGSVSIRLLPTCELTGSSLTFAIDLTAGEGRTHWDKTWSWERKPDSPWYRPWSLDRPALSPEMARAAMSLGGRPGLQVIEDDYGILTISTGAPVFSWEEWTGTGASHGDNSVLPAGELAADLYEDGPPALARSEPGEIRLAWTRDVPPGSQDGSQVMVALYRNEDNRFLTAESIPGSLGYNKDLNLVYDNRGLPLALWAQVDSSGLGPATSAEDFYARLNTGQIKYSVYQGGVWSSPQSGPLALAGNNSRPTLGRTHDNRVIAAWINRAGGGPARLMAAFWDGNAWSSPVQLAEGNLAGTPAAGTLGDRTALFWTQDADPSETASWFRI